MLPRPAHQRPDVVSLAKRNPLLNTAHGTESQEGQANRSSSFGHYRDTELVRCSSKLKVAAKVHRSAMSYSKARHPEPKGIDRFLLDKLRKVLKQIVPPRTGLDQPQRRDHRIVDVDVLTPQAIQGVTQPSGEVAVCSNPVARNRLEVVRGCEDGSGP